MPEPINPLLALSASSERAGREQQPTASSAFARTAGSWPAASSGRRTPWSRPAMRSRPTTTYPWPWRTAATVAAKLAGRDPTTDIAVLRVGDGSLQPLQGAASKGARVGQLVVALGRGREGVTANLGMISVAGGPWQSMRGGTIDSLIRLDMRLEPPCRGRPRHRCRRRAAGHGRVRAAPQAARHSRWRRSDRIGAKLLAEGRIRRGYLGLGLQPLRLDEALTQAHALSEPARHHGRQPRSRRAGACRRCARWRHHHRPRRRGTGGVRSLHARLTPESIGKSAELRIVRAGQIATANVTIGASPTP